MNRSFIFFISIIPFAVFRDLPHFGNFSNPADSEEEIETSNADLIYQPSAKLKYFGHRNARYVYLCSSFTRTKNMYSIEKFVLELLSLWQHFGENPMSCQDRIVGMSSFGIDLPEKLSMSFRLTDM